MKAETLSMVHVEQLAEGANPKYIEGLREWDYEEVITELARYNLAAERAMKQANHAVLAASETIQKLVAENAALKQERDDFKKSAEYSAATNKRIVAINIRLSDENTELKSDAAIAEIKAQGVALAIIHLSKKFTNLGVPITSLEWLEVEMRAGRKG